jgi:magnesium chelatase subunit I
MGRPTSIDVLAKMLKGNSHNSKVNPDSGSNNGEDYEKIHEGYTQSLMKWADCYNQADLPDYLRNYIARLYVKHNLESIRAIEAMQQGAVLYSIIKNRDQVTINDVTHMMPLILKHRLDSDTLIRVLNDIEKGGKESIFSFATNKKVPSKPDQAEEADYFKNAARPIKDLKRKELINTEKTLGFNAVE